MGHRHVAARNSGATASRSRSAPAHTDAGNAPSRFNALIADTAVYVERARIEVMIDSMPTPVEFAPVASQDRSHAATEVRASSHLTGSRFAVATDLNIAKRSSSKKSRRRTSKSRTKIERLVESVRPTLSQNFSS